MLVPGIRFVQGRNAYHDADGKKYGIGVHNTSNNASAANEAINATHRTDGVSAHLYGDNREVIQSLDTVDRAGHSGTSIGNENAVAIEITGVNGWSRQQWLDNVSWTAVGLALAHVVRFYGIEVRHASVAEMRANPKVKAFYSHNDMRLAWPGTTDHTDPGPNFPWDVLFAHVNGGLYAINSGLEGMDMHTASFAAITLEQTASSLNIPPVEAGGADPAFTWLNIHNDSFGEDVGYRIFASKGEMDWSPVTGGNVAIDANGLVVLHSGQRLSVQLASNISCVSITRMAVDAAGKAVQPDDAHKAYAGHLTIAFERKATA